MSELSNINTYIENTKNVCFYITLSIILIFIFIFSPLNRYLMASIIGKLIILALLLYALYQNVNSSMIFSKNTNIAFTDGSWTNIKTNVMCSYVFSLFILFLILKVARSIFY